MKNEAMIDRPSMIDTTRMKKNKEASIEMDGGYWKISRTCWRVLGRLLSTTSVLLLSLSLSLLRLFLADRLLLASIWLSILRFIVLRIDCVRIYSSPFQ